MAAMACPKRLPRAYLWCRHTQRSSRLLREGLLCWVRGGGRVWNTIEGPSEGGFSTIFRRFEVTFAQKVGDVWR